MLEQHEPQENINAAERRVTSEEFTQAIAALETRREEEAKRLAATVSIGETARELSLDATPDEIWAEVQAQRARQAAAGRVTPPPPVPQQTRPQTASPMPQTVIAARETSRRPRFRRVWVIIGASLLLFRIVSGHSTYNVDVHPTRSASAVAPSIRTLAEIPNGQTFYADMNTVSQVAHGKALTDVLVHTDSMDNGWPLIKHDGHLYLRGYTLPLSDDALLANPVQIYNDDNAGVLQGIQEDPITVRLDRLHWDSADTSHDDWGEITASHVHLDSHGREDW